MTWQASLHDGQPAFASTDPGLRVVVVPGVGGKIVSITGPAGTEYVWRQPGRPVRPIVDGQDFADADISGLDDCFPTVDPCADPDQPAGARHRDHGDVWHRSWEPTTTATRLSMRTTGTDLPYRLTKHLSVTDGRLRVDYDLTTTGRPFTYQWTGHLLLAATAAGHIEITGNPDGRTAFASTDRLRTGSAAERWEWPHGPSTDGSSIDLSVMAPRDAGVNEKVWLTAPADGTCRLLRPDGAGIVVEFDPEKLPWLALCTDYGGWPDDDPAYWVAVEPSTSGSDALADSARTGTARTIEPGEIHHWWWALRVVPAATDPNPSHPTP